MISELESLYGFHPCSREEASDRVEQLDDQLKCYAGQLVLVKLTYSGLGWVNDWGDVFVDWFLGRLKDRGSLAACGGDFSRGEDLVVFTEKYIRRFDCVNYEGQRRTLVHPGNIDEVNGVGLLWTRALNTPLVGREGEVALEVIAGDREVREAFLRENLGRVAFAKTNLNKPRIWLDTLSTDLKYLMDISR